MKITAKLLKYLTDCDQISRHTGGKSLRRISGFSPTYNKARKAYNVNNMMILRSTRTKTGVIGVPETEEHIMQELEGLRSASSSDLIAMAPLHGFDERIRWRYVLGNSNDRIRHMTVKTGHGLAGAALRFGRVISSAGHADATRGPGVCPIILAEHLLGAAAFPVKGSSGTIGLLYIGRRTMRHYLQEELAAVSDRIQAFASFMEERHNKLSK